MIYDEVGSGGMIVGGCGETDVRRHSSSLFAAGDVLYDLKKAQRGILEAVTIKKVRIPNTVRTGGIPRALYLDTFNSLWNERDLTDYGTALALVAEFDLPNPSLIGGGTCGGCAQTEFIRYLKTFYVIAKAMKGVLEKVVVKDVRCSPRGTVLYVDTMNAFWNQRELTDYNSAVAMATDYLQTLAEEVASRSTCPR